MGSEASLPGKRNPKAFSVRKNNETKKWDVISPDGVTVAHSGFETMQKAKDKAAERTASNQ